MFNLPNEAAKKIVREKILSCFQSAPDLLHWSSEQLEWNDGEIRFFIGHQDKIYLIYGEDFLSDSPEVESKALSLGFKITAYVPVKPECRSFPPEVPKKLNKFGDTEEEYEEEDIAPDYHYDHGQEEEDYSPQESSSEAQYQKDAALADAKIQAQARFEQWRIDFVLQVGADSLPLDTYLKYFAVAEVRRVAKTS